MFLDDGLQPGVVEPLSSSTKGSSIWTPSATPFALWTVALEISVLMASFPSRAIAQKSYDYRTLGLGYAQPRHHPRETKHSL